MKITLLLFALCLLPNTLRAESFVFGKKQETKEQKRWTLADWLSQKQKMRAMDLWLGFHRPSPYEFFMGGTYQSGTQNDAYYQRWWGHAAVYAYFFGAQYQRELVADSAKSLGLFHVRIFGIYQQATNITLEGGARYEVRNGVSLWNPVAGVASTIYLNRFLGVEGLYRYYFPTDEPTLGGKISANRFEANGFAEFRWFRLFAGYFQETENNETLSPTTTKGVFGGLRLYL